MKILGIDTTRKQAKIFILNNENKYIENINENIKHSEGLFLYLEKALLENNLELKDFDCFCAIVGPGSFTGIRVGMSVIKGFCKSLNKEKISLNTFEVLCEEIKNGVAILHSTNSTCYYAEIKNSKINGTGIIEKENIANKFSDKIYILKEEQNLIGLEYDNLSIVDNFDDLYFKALEKKINSNNYGSFEPYYLQLSQAERNLNDKSEN